MQNIYVGKNPDFSVLHLGQKQRMIGISSPLRRTDLRLQLVGAQAFMLEGGIC